MRRSLPFALYCLLLIAAPGFPQEILVRQKPDPSVPPVAVSLKRSVLNVDLQCKVGSLSESFTGTGFLVGYTDPRLQRGTFFTYLVTNRHVAECWDKDNHPREVRTLQVRGNLRAGSSKKLDLAPTEWRYPADGSVDLAVMPIALGDEWLASLISVDQFATKDFISSNQIAEGSPIILAGYFYQFPGQQRMQPIVRQGILSMIPDEPMDTGTGKLGTVYLCDVHIFGGNSGSPVLVTTDWLGSGGYRLLGVVSRYYTENAEFELEIATTIKGAWKANSGVAMIVPVDFLRALLDVPDLKRSREVYFTQHPGAPQR